MNSLFFSKEVEMAAKAKAKAKRPAHASPKAAPEEKGGRRAGGKPTYDNTNRGAIFLSDKGDNPKRPDYTGSVDLEIPDDVSPGDIVKFRVAGWLKTPNAGGDEFLSLLVEKQKPKSEL